jgi:hypothetical protein
LLATFTVSHAINSNINERPASEYNNESDENEKTFLQHPRKTLEAGTSLPFIKIFNEVGDACLR